MEFTTTHNLNAMSRNRPLHPVAGMIEDKLYELMDDWIANDDYWSTTTIYMSDIQSDIYGKDQDISFSKWVLSR